MLLHTLEILLLKINSTVIVSWATLFINLIDFLVYRRQKHTGTACISENQKLLTNYRLLVKIQWFTV